MDTTQDAISYLQHYKTPYWRIMNGTAKVGEYGASDNLEQSIADFKTALAFLPAGTYKLKAADKPDKYNGALETTFTKGQNSPAMQHTSFQVPSTNAYGIPDHVKLAIEHNARKDFMLEQLTNEVRELKETVRKIEQYLKEDADGDGTPDLFQTAKNAADTVQKVGEIKKVFSGSSVFGD